MKKLLLHSTCVFTVVLFFLTTAFSLPVKAEGQQASDGVTTTFGQDLFGAPQKSIEDAQKYVKGAFFYSTREDDKVDGDPLTDTTEALRLVKANRSGYYEEVVTSTYGQASEALTTGKEKAEERLKEFVNKVKSAETYDDKKAVGVLLANASVQERIERLSLELGLLELEAVRFLNDIPPEYIIARSAEEIEAEVTENIENAKSGKGGQK